MPRKNLLMLLCCNFLFSTIYATETEPNDVWNSADKLTLTVTDNGAIASASDIDWWKISIPADGQLNIAFTGLSGCMNMQVYDTLGAILVNGGAFNCGNTSNVNTNGLAKGTYYIKVYASGAASYSMNATYTAPVEANDTEPNNIFSTAQSLAQNGSTTGHFGYYFNNLRDTFDWFKIVTSTSGALQISYTQNTGNGCGYFTLFDNDGITALNSEGFNCGNTSVQTTDGLQPGTYYVRIRNYNGSFGTYTLANTLILPAISTEAEPNNIRGQAKVLQLNNSVSGQFGYRSNGGLRDSIDWWKVTTNAAGLVQLQYTQNTGNSCSYFQLYDNNASTALNSETFNCGGTSTQNTDGLNPGTYYVRIRPYITTSSFGTYTLKDTLFKPAIASDAEPNNTPAQALSLAVNGTNTGQFGYYYNNLRDSFEWHKITLPVSGGLQLQYTQNTGNSCSYMQLFDTVVGTPVALNAEVFNCGGTSTQNTDGLNPGTYYIRIRPYGDNTFGTYTVKDSLFALPPDNDNKPNERPYQASTLPANSLVYGDVGYLFNQRRDSADWAKINYTGTGALTLQFTGLSRAFAGPTCLYMYVYNDTNAAPISTTFNCGNTSTVNLTSLTQAYYWIKVQASGTSDFGPYSISNSFTQVNVASISLISSTAPTSCDSTAVLRFQCAGSKPPYNVQLYKFGVLNRTVRVPNTNAFNVTNLPTGLWTARVFGDGATGTAYGTSPNTSLMPVPTTLTTTSIQATQAKLNFSNFTPCIDGYAIQYRKTGTGVWTLDTAKQSPFTLKGLSAGTTYSWRAASGDTSNGLTALSKYSDSATFTTLAAGFASIASDNGSNASAYNANEASIVALPNPAQSQVKIQVGNKINEVLNATLKDVNGRVVWNKSHVHSTNLNNQIINVALMPNGIYILQVIGKNNKPIVTQKIIVAH